MRLATIALALLTVQGCRTEPPPSAEAPPSTETAAAGTAQPARPGAPAANPAGAATPVVSVVADAQVKPHGGAVREADNAAELAVFKFIVDSQQAGLQRHELAPYLAAFADDATMVAGRAATPASDDIVFDRATIEATRKIFFADPANTTLEFEMGEITLDGSTATANLRAISRSFGFTAVVAERYQLRRQPPGDWKITRNRWWLVESGEGATREPYDEARWKRLAAEVAALPPTAAPSKRARALSDAFEHREALAVAEAGLKRPEAKASDHVQVGYLALRLGKTERALKAWRDALALDPGVVVPVAARPPTR